MILSHTRRLYEWELTYIESKHRSDQELFSLPVYEKTQCLSVYPLHIYRDLKPALQFFFHIALEWCFCRCTNLAGGIERAKNQNSAIIYFYIQSKISK